LRASPVTKSSGQWQAARTAPVHKLIQL
jgi:hypothetical protein